MPNRFPATDPGKPSDYGTALSMQYYEPFLLLSFYSFCQPRYSGDLARGVTAVLARGATGVLARPPLRFAAEIPNPPRIP